MSTATGHEAARGARKVYCVMGARSLRYAKACIASLLAHSDEPLDLALLTDAAADAEALQAAIGPLVEGTVHRLAVHDQADADRRAETVFADYPAIRTFRGGHPCWRKITDPVLYAADGEEVVIIDPDVYFPNRFRFEPTPATGLLLMWQRPNCLLPEPLVREAYDRHVPMADHTDIGVCQFRAPLPYAVLEELLETLDTAPHAHSMHVESIVWAALAERMGGGYLDPTAWHCFGNSVAGRMARRFGLRDGVATLRGLGLGNVKALHAGGIAKDWLVDAEKAGLFAETRNLTDPTPVRPFVGYPQTKFDRKMRNRRIARQLGLYAVLGGG
ncbi:hypothetical protein GCM10011380_12190 [Sphingomonas metalli]|uniref:Uncharacterized protein n=1 Tax=Sphingomonas metalli TaxID=1779358 RepID=A0A916WQX2_9SPHN|nr:hypothetical protein [Sphingomonas metalli]GGB24184.1 hypothetical protein GCM10011380_12190 [Sphingomonas metalli]